MRKADSGFGRGSNVRRRWRIIRQIGHLRYRKSALLNSVAHGTKTRERLFPLVAWRASNDAHHGRAAESQPLHHGDRGIVLAAGRVDARFISGRAVDPK